MTSSLSVLGAVVVLELRQRVRSVAWYVLLGVSAVLLLIVSLLLLGVAASVGRQAGPQVFSIIVFFVLLLGSLVTPALSGAAVNGDREAGTLATTQITLVTARQLLLGKFLAAWTASLAFLVVALPFLLLAILAGRVDPVVVLVALLVTVVELGVVAAIGVGLSSVIARPIFSVVTTYLVVAALSLGSAIAFGLGGVALQTPITSITRSYDASAYDQDTGEVQPGATCTADQRSTDPVPRYDRVWVLLAVNPFVVLADAAPGQWDKDGPQDAFSAVKSGLRGLETAPADPQIYDDCNPSRNTEDRRTPEQRVAGSVPGWGVGIGLHLLLAVLALVAGGFALRTPTRRLPKGSRIA